MWRFMENVEPPEKKKKQPKEDVIDKQREYDKSKCSRNYQSKWTSEFKHWLLYDGKLMYCKPCRSAYGKLSVHKLPDLGGYRDHSRGPFVAGSSNLKHSTLVAHEKSKGHMVAVEHSKTRILPVPGKSPAESMLQKLNSLDFKRLCILFRNAHAIAKKSRPFSDFKWLADLNEKNGVDCGTRYRNINSCKEFVAAIHNVEKQTLRNDMDNRKFLTLISDGSTDVSAVENEIVYVRSARLGIAKIIFSSIEAVDKADAEGIYAACTRSLSESFGEESLQKVVGFAADGASVNTGQLNGVIAKLRERLSPSIVMVKCLAHRLELAFQNALDGKLFKSLTKLLSLVYKLYKKPLQRSNLKKEFAALGLSPVFPTRIGGTRWLSHTLTAVMKLKRCYKPIVQHVSKLKDDKTHGPKAKALTRLLHSKGVIHFMLFTQDVLAILSRLSQEIQRSESNIYLVHEQLKACLSSLRNLEDSPGQMLAECFTTDYYQGEKLVGAFTYPKEAIEKLTTSMENRFSDLEDSLLKSTKIADLTSWPLEFDGEFGDESVKTIIAHFQDIFTNQGCDVGLMMCEWDHLKQLLYENEKIYEVSWETVNKKYKVKCPNILDLVDLILSLPASSAECERGFSTMKVTKTDYRNRLSSHNLSAELADFDPGPAIHHWNNRTASARRPRGPPARTLLLPMAKGTDHDPDHENVELEEAEVAEQPVGAGAATIEVDDKDQGFDSLSDSDMESVESVDLDSSVSSNED